MNLLTPLLGAAAWLSSWALLLTIQELGALAPRVTLSLSARHRLRLLALFLNLIGLILLRLSVWFWVAWTILTLLIAYSLVVSPHDRNQTPPEE